eukprot:CAMPEP_0119336796 /NCGR_PEP_ID=MMETSP1333-20130426/92598_1 /TAXON_ID=418940 /ORGANISM="Scyphosphaera apsteinii, Strain RCC1455" /LENGTH=61 /DNA_ID=CAMNT_0007347663 /DNA_START=31 /DNA_END=216 /DNA_ORIENTATION=+
MKRLALSRSMPLFHDALMLTRHFHGLRVLAHQQTALHAHAHAPNRWCAACSASEVCSMPNI